MSKLLQMSIGDDNQACIADAYSCNLSKLAKHVDLKYQFIFHHVQKKDVGLHCSKTEEMIADMSAKNLNSITINRFLKLSGMH